MSEKELLENIQIVQTFFEDMDNASDRQKEYGKGWYNCAEWFKSIVTGNEVNYKEPADPLFEIVGCSEVIKNQEQSK